MGTVLLAALAAASLGADARQFDLVCPTTQVIATQRSDGLVAEDETTVHIDLAHRRWCINRCSMTNDILRVTPTLLVLEDLDHTDPTQIRSTYNRQSREFVRITYKPEVVTVDHGVCEMRKFTGLPRPVERR